MTDMIKCTEYIAKEVCTEGLQREKCEKTMDYENNSSNNLDLVKQKSIQTNLKSQRSNSRQREFETKSNIGTEIINLESEESQILQKTKSDQFINSLRKQVSLGQKGSNNRQIVLLNDQISNQQKSVSGQESKYSILNSETLNQKCTKCSSTLLCLKTSKPASKWMQCMECLQMVHSPCEIQSYTNNLKIPACNKCISKKPLFSNKPIVEKTLQKPKTPTKSFLKKSKLFKQQMQGFRFLDSFLSGFSYKLAITDQQTKKDTKILQKNMTLLKTNEKSMKR